MNWFQTTDGNLLNLSRVLLIAAHDGGHYAYFSIPDDGEPWASANRLAISSGDYDLLLEKLDPESP